MTLQESYNLHCVTGPDVGHGDKGGTHSYIDTYAKLLEPYRSGKTLMEIGIAFGLSLEMWKDYMPYNQIVGVDLSIVFEHQEEKWESIKLIEHNATMSDILDKLGDMRFDVVIDDASHMLQDQVKTFQILKSRMNKGGLYFIEDILNLEHSRNTLLALHPNCEIHDLRHIKGRFDDVLVVYRF